MTKVPLRKVTKRLHPLNFESVRIFEVHDVDILGEQSSLTVVQSVSLAVGFTFDDWQSLSIAKAIFEELSKSLQRALLEAVSSPSFAKAVLNS